MSIEARERRRIWLLPVVLVEAVSLTGFGLGLTLAQEPTVPTTESVGGNQPLRNTSHWNLPKKVKLAIKGYDPVAYFPESGNRATKGKEKFEYQYRGVTYRFANEVNRERFISNPSRYEPAHGGWCSYAMAKEGGKTSPDPKSFIVKHDRLFLFYKGIGGDTKKAWMKMDHAMQVDNADRAWRSISGEEPRANVFQNEAN